MRLILVSFSGGAPTVRAGRERRSHAALRQQLWNQGMPRRIFKPYPSTGSELCHPIREEDWDTVAAAVDRDRCADDWQPISMALITQREFRTLGYADAPWLGPHALILRSRAIAAMEPVLTNNGELLPLLCNDADLYLFNPRSAEEVFDETASDVKRFSDGRLMIVERHVFKPLPLQGLDAFKIPTFRAAVFVSEAFVARWKDAGLRGLDFRQVWPHVEEESVASGSPVM